MAMELGERGIDDQGRPCVYIHLNLQLCSDPETGIWCNGCSLPARVRFKVVSLGADGVSDFGTHEACITCDGYEHLFDEDDQ